MITGFRQVVQLSVFIKSIGAGFFIGLIFLFYIAMNTINGKNKYIVAVRDVIFFVSSAIITFLFSLKYNAGILRFYILAGELIGFILCYLSLSGTVRKYSYRFFVLLLTIVKKIKEKISKNTKKLYKNS